MKTRSPYVALAAAAAFASFASVPPAAAADHPRVKPENCSKLAKSPGRQNVWYARFYGENVDINGVTQWDREAPCFSTKANCVDWLYWAQSDFPRNITLQRCRRGTP